MSKEALRRDARAWLARLTPQDRHAASERIADAVWTVPEIAGARTLLLFAGRRDEVETDGIAREAVRRGIRLAYPRVLGNGRMTLHAVDSHDALAKGAFRIREPETTAGLIPIHEVDAALLPALAWDRVGGRLGRGAGYFDRVLGDPAWRGFRCGVLFAALEVPEIPMEPWDVRLDAVVTEREVWRMAPGERATAINRG